MTSEPRRIGVVTRVVAAAGVASLAALAAGVEPARACSCAVIDPRSTLARSDGAFVGTFVEKRAPANPRSSADDAVYVFRVLEAVKGRFGRTVEVRSAVSGASCGLEVAVGATIGLFVDRAGGVWRSNLCQQTTPQRLRAARRPLAPPNGRGPAAFLVAGQFGTASTMALDARGRTLAYGRGTGDVLALAVCPGSRRSVELARRTATTLVVRRLPDLSVLRRRVVALGRGVGALPLLSCADPAAADVRVFWSGFAGRRPVGRIVSVGVSSERTLWRGVAAHGALGHRHAYVAAGARGTRLVRIDLRTRRAETVRSIASPTGLELRADGRELAWVSRSRLRVVDPTSRRARVRSVRLRMCCASRIAFLPGGGVVMIDDTLRIFDRRLRQTGRVAGWNMSAPVVRDGRVLGLTAGGALYAARLPSGPARRLRVLPSPLARLLVAVPPR